MINFHRKLIINCIIKSSKDVITKKWEVHPQVKNDNAINSFKNWLQRIIKADGGYIERSTSYTEDELTSR